MPVSARNLLNLILTESAYQHWNGCWLFIFLRETSTLNTTMARLWWSTKVRSILSLATHHPTDIQTNETLSRLAGLISKIFQNISIPNNQIFIQHFRNSAVSSQVWSDVVWTEYIYLFTVDCGASPHRIFINIKEFRKHLNKYNTNYSPDRAGTRNIAGKPRHDMRFPVLCLEHVYFIKR